MLPPLKRPSLSLVSKSTGNQNATLSHHRAPRSRTSGARCRAPQIIEARRFIPIPRARMLASAAPKPKLSGQVRQHGLTGCLGFGVRLEGVSCQLPWNHSLLKATVSTTVSADGNCEYAFCREEKANSPSSVFLSKTPAA